jgi:hypothetical protein
MSTGPPFFVATIGKPCAAAYIQIHNQKRKFVTCTCTDSHHLSPQLSHGLSCEQGEEASKLGAKTRYTPYNNSKSWIKSAILEMLNVFLAELNVRRLLQ